MQVEGWKMLFCLTENLRIFTSNMESTYDLESHKAKIALIVICCSGAVFFKLQL